MSINGFIAILTVILSLKANYYKATTGAKFVVLGLVVGGLLLLLNLPATVGIPFYPWISSIYSRNFNRNWNWAL